MGYKIICWACGYVGYLILGLQGVSIRVYLKNFSVFLVCVKLNHLSMDQREFFSGQRVLSLTWILCYIMIPSSFRMEMKVKLLSMTCQPN